MTHFFPLFVLLLSAKWPFSDEGSQPSSQYPSLYRHTIKARVSAWRQIYTAWKHWREKGAAGHEEDIWYSRILLWVDAQDVIGPCDPDATPLNAEWGKWEEANTAPFAPAASQTHAALVFRSPRFESARSFYFSIFIAILLELAGVER